MFPLQMTKHSMKMREGEKYFVQHAKTERLRKSAIPYMQRLLNQNQKEEEWKRRSPG